MRPARDPDTMWNQITINNEILSTTTTKRWLKRVDRLKGRGSKLLLNMWHLIFVVVIVFDHHISNNKSRDSKIKND